MTDVQSVVQKYPTELLAKIGFYFLNRISKRIRVASVRNLIYLTFDEFWIGGKASITMFLLFEIECLVSFCRTNPELLLLVSISIQK